MTTAQIESRADPSGAAVADIDLKIELRHNVIPEFLEDVGYVAWRRKYISKTLAAAASYVDVSDSTYSFAHMKQVFLDTEFDRPLFYIGEDPMEVLKAKANTTAGKPTGYYLEDDGNDFQRVSFNCPAQQKYTVWMTLDMHIKFPNDTDSLDLNRYIPRQFQWGLVTGLRKTIYRERFGIGDERYQEASAEFEKWKMRAKKSPEGARRETSKYAR